MSSDIVEIPDDAKDVVLIPIAVEESGGLKVQFLMYLIVVCAFGAWFIREASPGVFVLGLIWFLMMLVSGAVSLGVILVQRSTMQRESLLGGLGIAAEQSLPLAPAALAFADQYGWSYRKRVRLFATLLNSGLSVSDALDRVPKLISDEAEVLVRMGSKTGTLARSLKEASGIRTERNQVWGQAASRFTYLIFTALAIQVIIGFVFYFIIPKFEAIFKDFGMSLPPATIFAIKASHWLMGWFGLPLFFLVLAEVVLMVMLPIGLHDAFWFHIPLAQRFFRRRHTSIILRSLALAAGGGKSIVGGLSVLARDYPSRWVRSRLKRVLGSVQEGGDWVESMHAMRLIGDGDPSVLRSAQKVGNLDWALGELAESNDRRLEYRLQLILQMIFPLMVLGLGFVVLVIAVAFLSPLFHLIERLAR